MSNNAQGADVKPLENYLTAFFQSKQYQSLPHYEKQRAIEYLNANKVEPFFNSKGLKGPGIQYLNTLAAPYTTEAAPKEDNKPAPAGPGMQFIRGTEEGFAQGAAGVVKASLKYNPFAWAGSKIENALLGTDRINEGKNTMLDRLSIVRANISDFFDDNFGKPQSLVGAVSKGTGDIVGQAPYWNKIAGAVKLIPWIGEAAEGTLLTRARLIQQAGQDARVITEGVAPLAQKAIASGLEGGAIAYGTGEDNKTAAEWAAIGAAIPVVGAGGSKLWTILRGTRGPAGANAIAQQGLKLAQTPLAQRPAPTNTAEAVASAVAKVVDQQGPKAAAEKISAAMETLNSASAVDVAKEQFNATRKASPVAVKVNDAVSTISQAAGVKPPVEQAAEKAEESITRGTVDKTLIKGTPQTVSQTVPETTNALDSQLLAVGKGDKAAVAWAVGKGPSANIPNNLKMVSLKGQVIVFNPKVSGLTSEKIKAMVMDGRLNEVLGYPVSKETVAKAVAKGEKPVVVTAKDSVTGAEVQSAVASTSSTPATVEAVKTAHPTAKVEVQPAKVAGDLTLDRITGELKHNYNNMIAAEQGAAMAEALGKTHTAVDTAGREAKISELAKQFIEQGGSKEELDKMMADFEINRAAKIESAKAFAEKAKASKSAGQVVTVATANPEAVVKAAKSKADKLKEQAALAMEVANGGKAASTTPTPDTGTSMVDAVAAAEAKLKSGSKQVAATGATPEEIKASKQTIRFELKDLGLDSKDDVYRRVLGQFGFKKAEEVPPNLLNDVREALRAAKIKTSTFEEVDLGGTKAYEYQADGEGSVHLSPSKVFDASTKFNPEFVHEVSLKHPELIGGRSLSNVDAIDLLGDVTKKIGPDETNKLLTDMGYDAISYGRPGHGERYIVEMLDGSKVADKPIEEAKALAAAATNTGIRDEQVGDTAVDAALKAKEILDKLKAKKKVTKFGPGAASINDPNFTKETAVTSMVEAQKDTDFFAQAKSELGPDASISKIALRAQKLKEIARGE